MSLQDIPLGLTFDDVLLVPQRSGIRSRRDISLETQLTRQTSIDIPIVAANMDTVCETEMAAAMARLGGVGIIHRFLSVSVQAAMVKEAREIASQDVEDAGKVVVGAAIGTDHDTLDRTGALLDAGADVLVLDIAHGHADHALETLRDIKANFARAQVVAGNVATRAGADDLVAAGADAVKVGVGPGGVCTTRLVAGVGVPQLSAINNCSDLLDAEGNHVPVIADGGIRGSGDIAKALGAGASTVMLGSLFAGTKESPGDVEQSNRGLVKRVRGMASFEAIEARAARSGEDVNDEYFEQRAPEGVEGTVPYRGEVSKVVAHLLAGVRSGMSYCDARTIDDFWAKASFIRVTNSGVRENKPHATINE
ncbi:MAG: IMP dehydrogenase [Actinomycetia bacterium]|nr:IMP dehydrogenase [Actinomycetes bacterium]MCP5030213.1 IMP dehydrogenase [Actinomycetes bacterium]